MNAAPLTTYPRSGSASPKRGAGSCATLDQVQTRRVRWRVQRAGTGPGIVLLHGTGAAMHSWRSLVPRLARHFAVVVPDLPGHGGSEILDPGVMSLPDMASELGELLVALDVSPALVVGHSAGAALAVRATLDGHVQPACLIAINGAFVPYGGAAGRLLAPLAQLCGSSRLVTAFFARKARDPRAVARVIASTGSSLDASALKHYSRVLQKPSHMAATFAMMANWDLRTLHRDLRNLAVPLHLLVADNDSAVNPAQASGVARTNHRVRISYLPGLGHVAHEEDPARITRYIFDDAKCCGAL